MTRRPTPRPRRALLLVEVLLALAISGMVALTVASVLFALSSGARDRDDTRRRNARRAVLANRVGVVIRSSSVLLASDGKCLVLWVGDRRKNGKPDLSELRRIEWDPATRQLWCYQPPPDGLADADDVTFELTADFLAATAPLRGTASFPGEAWSGGVTAWAFTPAGTPPGARNIAYTGTLTGPAATFTVTSSATLRGTSGRDR